MIIFYLFSKFLHASFKLAKITGFFFWFWLKSQFIYQLKHEVENITDEIKKEIILEHFDAMLKFHGPHGAIMFRKLLHSYSKGYTGANEFRDIVNKISEIDVMRDMIDNFF